jgi:hypothetical protein
VPVQSVPEPLLDDSLVEAYRDCNYRVIANSRSIKPSKDSDVLDPKTADRPCLLRQRIVPFARIGMAICRQLLFPKSEQWVTVQHMKTTRLSSARRSTSDGSQASCSQFVNSRRAERTLATMYACTSDTLRV